LSYAFLHRTGPINWCWRADSLSQDVIPDLEKVVKSIMKIKAQYTIDDGAYAMDGGSIYLSLRDTDGVKHTLILAQYRIPRNESDPRIPGRLYLDDQVIGVRSDEEARLISAIKKAPISLTSVDRPNPKQETGPTVVIGDDIADYLSATRTSPEAAIRLLVDSLVEFVESEEYVKFAVSSTEDDEA
jgi:hypothetical protein